MTDLDTRLLAAHEAYDRPALIGLYAEAAEQATSDIAHAFYMTQAYVCALETGSALASPLRERLVAMGSETALQPTPAE